MKPVDLLIGGVNRIPLYFATAAIVATVLYLTLMPAGPDMGMDIFPHADKVVHFLMFGAVAVSLWWDISRRGLRIDMRGLCVSVVLSSLLGGAVELLQQIMDIGRSCDVWDWVADTAGALMLPIMMYPLLRRSVADYGFHTRVLRRGDKVPQSLRGLYVEAFPPEERRDWADVERRLSASDGVMNMTVVYCRRRQVGFITWWRLDGMIYVEHFAVMASERGGGIGAKTMKRFVEEAGRPVVLEVEPSGANDMASRRIAFYERCGFVAVRDYEYIQPPYGPGLPEVPLMLMTSDVAVDPAVAASLLHRHVYGRQ